MRRLLLIGLVASVFAVWDAPAALGCSCAIQDPSIMLEESDAAFIGTLTEAPERPAGPAEMSAVWVFGADEWVKGDLGPTVGVQSGFGGGDCGFEIGVGEQIGVFLHNDGGHPSGGLCSTVTPEGMRAADRPLVFDGSGPPVFLVSGQSGRTRLATYDSAGRMIAAVGDERTSWTVSVCPGNETVVEVVEGSAIVRRVSDLSEVRSTSPPPHVELADVWCLSETGDTLMGLLIDWDAERGWVADLDDPTTEIVSGPADAMGQAAVAGSTLAVPTHGPNDTLTLVDLETGDRSELVGGADVYRADFSPDGSRLLVARTVHHDGGWELGIAVHDTEDGRLVTELGPLPDSEPYGWLGNSEVLVGHYDDPDGAPSTVAIELETGTARPVVAPGFEHLKLEHGTVSVHEGVLWFTSLDGESRRLMGLPSAHHRLAAVLDTDITPQPVGTTTTTIEAPVTGPPEAAPEPGAGPGPIVIVTIVTAASAVVAAALVARGRRRRD